MCDEFGFNGGEFEANGCKFVRIDQGFFSLDRRKESRVYFYGKRLDWVDKSGNEWGVGESEFQEIFGDPIKQVIINGKIDYVFE